MRDFAFVQYLLKKNVFFPGQCPVTQACGLYAQQVWNPLRGLTFTLSPHAEQRSKTRLGAQV
jgi:hypothetical protein